MVDDFVFGVVFTLTVVWQRATKRAILGASRLQVSRLACSLDRLPPSSVARRCPCYCCCAGCVAVLLLLLLLFVIMVVLLYCCTSTAQSRVYLVYNTTRVWQGGLVVVNIGFKAFRGIMVLFSSSTDRSHPLGRSIAASSLTRQFVGSLRPP